MLAAARQRDNEETPAHIMIEVSRTELRQAKQHLSMMLNHAKQSNDYGGLDVGCNSASAFSLGPPLARITDDLRLVRNSDN
jgi:hypothetical protein